MKNILDYLNQFFRDNKGRMIYYVAKEKHAYLVNESDRVPVSLLHQRMSISIVVGLILFLYKVNPIICIIVVILVMAILDLILKKVFLTRYTFFPKYDIEANTKKEINDKEYKKQLWIGWVRIILALVFIVISFIAKDQQETIQTVLLILAGFVFLISGIKNQFQLLRIINKIK